MIRSGSQLQVSQQVRTGLGKDGGAHEDAPQSPTGWLVAKGVSGVDSGVWSKSHSEDQGLHSLNT